MNNLKKIFIIIIAFASFRCGDDIPDGVVDTPNGNIHVAYMEVPQDSVFYNPSEPISLFIQVNNGDLVNSISYSLESPDGYEIITNEHLKDSSDTRIYTGTVALDSTNLNGKYSLSIYVEKKDKDIFKAAESSFIYDNGGINSPPVISDLTAPSEIKVLPNETVDFFVYVKASDPNGLNDISEVYFQAYRPDGSTGSKTSLNDKGTLGDQTADDGVYSTGLSLPSTTTKGKWRFEFRAVDRKGAVSNIINHEITIE